jgi:hypothetical protein
VQANFPYLKPEAVKSAVDRFYGLRIEMKKHPNTEKEVSTSELLDWMRAIAHFFEEKVKAELGEPIRKPSPHKTRRGGRNSESLGRKTAFRRSQMSQQIDALAARFVEGTGSRFGEQRI